MKKTSIFGISSFILSILAGAGTFLTILIAGYIELSTPGGISEESLIAVTIGLIIFAMFFLNLIGVILGTIGLFEKEKARFFPIIGIVLNSMIFLGTILLVIVGNHL